MSDISDISVPPIPSDEPSAGAVDEYELRQHRPVPYYPLAYLAVIGVVAGGYLLLSYVCSSLSFGSGWEQLNVGYLIADLGVVHFVLSIRIVPRNQIGGLMLLGKPTIIVSGGPVLVLFGFFELVTETARVHELKWPEDPSKVYYGHEDKIPEGFEMPIRIPFADSEGGAADDADNNDPTMRRTTNTVSLFVRIAVRQDEFWDFYTRIGNIEDNARSQVRGMSISFINQELTRLTLSEALKKIEEVSTSLLHHIRQETKGWGVEIVTARLQLIELSYSLNKSLEDAAESAAVRRATMTKAEGTRAQLTLEGEGRANAVAAELEARGRGLKKQAAELGLEPKDVLAAEIARDLASSEATKIVIPGAENILNLASGIAQAFKTNSREPGATP